MRHVVLNEFGGPDVLAVQTIPELAAGPGEVLVEVEAAGVNFLDVTQRAGVSAVHRVGLPFVPGLEGVGRILALGEGVGEANDIAVGARVAWMDGRGSYASHAVIRADRLVPIPDDFSLSQGLIFQALTAHYLVHEYRNVKPGDRVLVHAASGGLGQLLVQWFRHLGARVFGTVSTEEKAAIVRALGAEAVIYGADYDFKDQVMALTGGKGVDLAIDGLGEKTLLNTIATLGRGGIVVAIGAASGPIPVVAPPLLTPLGLRLAGGSVFTYVADPLELRQRASDVVQGIREGWLQVENATAYPLERAADAHADLENRRAKGKLYLKP